MERPKLGPEGFERIAIVGSAMSSTLLAPFDDPKWSLWCCSPAVFAQVAARRSDVWFELHRWMPYSPGRSQETGVRPWFSPEYAQFLTQHKGPVFMTDVRSMKDPGTWEELLERDGPVFPGIPTSTPFPYEFLLRKHGPYHFSSTIAWMLALALEYQPKAIGMFGVDMSAQEEWCVAPETRVLTSDLRWVEAGSLSEGDELIAFDEAKGGEGGNYRAWKPATVQLVQRLRRPCKRLHMEDGSTLVSSNEHRWLTYAEHENRWRQNRWRQTDEMVTPAHRPDRPTRIVKLLDMWREETSWESGYLAGAFDGEGHLVQINRAECDGAQVAIGFAQRDNAMSAAVLSAAQAMGFDLRPVGTGGQNGDCIKYRIAGGKAKLMEFLGRIRPRRLMSKFRPDILGKMHRKDAVAVVGVEDIGEQDVIGLKTSTGTFVAEGFASHNSYQRPGCQHFIGLARALGIEIVLPPESDLMRHSTLYGIGEHNHRHVKLREQLVHLEAQQAALQNAINQNGASLNRTMGQIDMLKHMLGVWSDDLIPDEVTAMSYAGRHVVSH